MFLKGQLLGLRQFLTIENPLKMMKIAFYLMLKTLFVLEIFTFLSWHFDYVEKRLDKKYIVNLKIFDVRKWTIDNNMLTNISVNRNNQVMKLIKYIMRNSFLQKSRRKSSFRPLFFLKKRFIYGKDKWLTP